ncbi:hypothetical protein S40293_10704 [Stachybotrys chartarum IBT 40293]|nr:hypothetical protein S40293_10704 [Stachybotrys chartarum IBT 40293]
MDASIKSVNIGCSVGVDEAMVGFQGCSSPDCHDQEQTQTHKNKVLDHSCPGIGIMVGLAQPRLITQSHRHRGPSGPEGQDGRQAAAHEPDPGCCYGPSKPAAIPYISCLCGQPLLIPGPLQGP